MATNNNIRAYVRFRPFNKSDAVQETSYSITSSSKCSIGHQTFTVDQIFGPETSQRDFFYDTVAINVDSAIGGCSSSIIAYGQTAAGKSFTMTGGNQRGEEGLIPRAIERIFTCNEKIDSQYVEIYNERVYDLYNNREPVQLLSDGSFKNARVVGSTSAVGMISELREGLLLRSNASTKMNDSSSRSHAALIMTLANGAKLMMVDLAGSETVGKTLASGSVLKESGNINKSLTALAMIIKSLANPSPGQTFISYRNSKLTQMLQSALGGKSITTMIINCSPSTTHAQETVNSLRFGVSAKLVKNKDPNPKDAREFAELHAWQNQVTRAMASYKLHSVQHADKYLNATKAPPCLELPTSHLVTGIDIVQQQLKSKERAFAKEIPEKIRYVESLRRRVSECGDTLNALKIQQETQRMASQTRRTKIREIEEAQMDEARQNFRDMLEKLGSQKLRNFNLRLEKKM